MKNDIKRYRVCKTIGGGIRGYGVEDTLSFSGFPKRFNCTLTEAEKYCYQFNKKGWKLNFWERLTISKYQLKSIKEQLYREQNEKKDKL